MYSQYQRQFLAGIAASYITRPLLLWRLRNLLEGCGESRSETCCTHILFEGYRESRSCTHSTRDSDNCWQVLHLHHSFFRRATKSTSLHIALSGRVWPGVKTKTAFMQNLSTSIQSTIYKVRVSCWQRTVTRLLQWACDRRQVPWKWEPIWCQGWTLDSSQTPPTTTWEHKRCQAYFLITQQIS